MRHFLFPAFALCFALSASAQPSDEATHRKAPPSPPAQAKIQPGELRLDGQISAILDANQWQMDVISWTSPAGQVTPFDEKHSKNIRLSKSTWVHRAKSQREKLAKTLWYRGDQPGAHDEVAAAQSDYTSANLLPDADRVVARLHGGKKAPHLLLPTKQKRSEADLRFSL